MSLDTHERERWRLWVHWCETSAVLPWLETVLRLAQAAEDDATYRGTLATRARLQAQWEALDARLAALDPAWYAEVIAPRGLCARWRARHGG